MATKSLVFGISGYAFERIKRTKCALLLGETQNRTKSRNVIRLKNRFNIIFNVRKSGMFISQIHINTGSLHKTDKSRKQIKDQENRNETLKTTHLPISALPTNRARTQPPLFARLRSHLWHGEGAIEFLRGALEQLRVAVGLTSGTVRAL